MIETVAMWLLWCVIVFALTAWGALGAVYVVKELKDG